MHDFGHRGQAVGGAGGIRKDIVFGGIIFSLVDTHDDGKIFAFCRSGNDYFFGAGLDMGGGFVSVRKASS